MNTVNLIFPHQLFQNSPLLSNGNPVYLVEEYLLFKEFLFHRMKIAFHRASMKYYEDYLLSRGCEVYYIEAGDERADIRELIAFLSQQGIQKIHYIDPTDNWLQKRIHASTDKHSIKRDELETPLFLNKRGALGDFFKVDKKSYFQTTFYKQQRNRYQILLNDDGKPCGGQWTFDTQNRKKYPKNSSPPTITFPQQNDYWDQALHYTRSQFNDNPGELSDAPIYPVSHQYSVSWLEQFMEYRFHEFGDYEDAIVSDQMILHHSVLSPMLNVGLISVDEIVQRALSYAQQHSVPLNSVEGFIRQLIGWREFIRGMYEVKGTESRNRNYWGFKRPVPASFYNATTGIEPLDNTIRKVLKTGYCHHIERLMVLGNFMLLCEFNPDEVYRWFMELFIDAYDWVMVPNVYGMSQFADGGLFATKPYISGSNYLMKMSDYKKGDWQATWDGLFWSFMHVHRDFFLNNPRLAMLVHSFDKMPVDKRSAHLQAAESFLQRLVEKDG